MLRPWIALVLLGTLVLSGVTSCRSAPNRPGPNIVLVVLDTTRADRISYDDDSGLATPGLAGFARDAIRFDRAYSTSSWTVASHASLFTGLLPATHQATQENLLLDSDLETLAEILAARGYQTAAFSNNTWVSGTTDLTQGFETLAELWSNRPGSPDAEPAHPTNEAVRAWLSARDSGRPFFLFVNFIEPHWPYAAPQEYLTQVAGDRPELVTTAGSGFSAIEWYVKGQRGTDAILEARAARYDAEVAYVDAIVQRLFDVLEVEDVFDDSLLVVTSDHGENLGEHGHQGHSFTLYDSTIRVPLLIRPPGGAGPDAPIRTDPVQLTDVFTTLARAAGVTDYDPRVVGQDLLAGPVPDDRPVVTEYYRPDTFLARFPRNPAVRGRLASFRRRIRSIQVGSDKLIWGSDGRHELYDVTRDPGELENLALERPEVVESLAAQLEATVARLSRSTSDPRPGLSRIDPETIENLRALGYLP